MMARKNIRSAKAGKFISHKSAVRKKVSLPRIAAMPGIELTHVRHDDPYEAGAKRDGVKNIRVHPLDHLLARDRISVAQKAAGDELQRFFECAEVGGVRGIDPSKVRVDTTMQNYDPSGMVLHSQRQLSAVRLALGVRAWNLLVALIRDRVPVYELATQADARLTVTLPPYAPCTVRVAPSRSGVNFMHFAIGAALDDAALALGMIANGKPVENARKDKKRN